MSANRQSYMPHCLAQQRMTLSDLEWPFHALHAISVVAELLVFHAQQWPITSAKPSCLHNGSLCKLP